MASFIFPQLPSSILLMVSAKASLKNDSQGVMPKNNKKWFWEPILIINNNTGQAVKPWLGLASAFKYIQYITAQPKLLFLPFMFHGYAKLSLIFKTLFLHVYSWSFLSPLSKLLLLLISFHFTVTTVVVIKAAEEFLTFHILAFFNYRNNLKSDFWKQTQF